MILQSRRWRLVIRVAALLITTLLMLAFAGPASYALQDDTPKLITAPAQLASKDKPVAGSYIKVRAVPDTLHAVAVKEWTSTVYYIPLGGFDRELFVRTDQPRYLFPYDYDPATGFVHTDEIDYAGKVVPLSSQISADSLAKALTESGANVDMSKAMVLTEGEAPQNYRPMVPVMPVLAWLWLAALVGIVQIWRRRVRRRLAASPATAQAR